MQNIYDNKKFFDEYIKMRDNKVNANNVIEKPIFREMLPKMQGKRVLDLGCGYGDLCMHAINNGAVKVVGADISKKMIELAKEKNANKNIEYIVKPMEKIADLTDKFDIIVSSLAFHYVEDFDKLIKDISYLLKPNGVLLFSQEHPIATAFMQPNEKKIDSKIVLEDKKYYLLSDYNNVGKRVMTWNIDGVIKFHRNMETIINTLIKYGLKIEQIVEPKATEDILKLEPKYINQNDRPHFLFVRARKDREY